MTNFVLRGVDDAVWKRVRVKAANKGVTIQSVAVGLLDMWSDDRLAIDVGVPPAYRGGDTTQATAARKRPKKGRKRR